MKCGVCAKGCDKCANEYECLECKAPFVAVNGYCTNCKKGTYFDTVEKKCMPCLVNCLECQDGNSCDLCRYSSLFNPVEKTCPCPQKEYLIDGACKSCPSNCVSCKGPTECKKCNSPYILKEGMCTQPCKKGYMYDQFMRSCISCINDCDACSTFDTCDKCSEGFYFDKGIHGCIQVKEL